MLLSLAVSLAVGPSNPCTLLDAGDIARVLGWTVVAGAVRDYAMPGGAGTMCAFDGQSGSIIVTIPSKGSGLPVNDLTGGMGAMRTPLHAVYGVGTPVEVGRGAAIVHVRGRDYGITVQPIDAEFVDDAQMRALAHALLKHVPRPHGRPSVKSANG